MMQEQTKAEQPAVHYFLNRLSCTLKSFNEYTSKSRGCSLVNRLVLCRETRFTFLTFIIQDTWPTGLVRWVTRMLFNTITSLAQILFKTAVRAKRIAPASANVAPNL